MKVFEIKEREAALRQKFGNLPWKLASKYMPTVDEVGWLLAKEPNADVAEKWLQLASSLNCGVEWLWSAVERLKK